MRVLLAVLAMAVVLFPLTANAIDVWGDQSGTWTRDNSPYNVIGQVQVPPGETLVIEPGVVVNFRGHYMLLVQSGATLLAVGTEADSIYFTAENHYTGWYGIRFYSASSNSQVSYCILEYGSAPGHGEESRGGAIYCHYSSPTVTHNTMRNNYANNGGGIISYYGSPTISHNHVINNSANCGGGVRPWGGQPTITYNTIEGNTAIDGGGIFSSYSNATISHNIIKNNSANNGWDGGGGIYVWNESPEISYNLIVGNSTNLSGGGIYIHWEPPYIGSMIKNNTIYGNTAWYGGGIYFRENSHPTVVNTILWENTAYYGGPELYVVYGGYPSVTYCDVRGGWSGQGNINADPLFVNPGAGDFHLQGGSPCIDSGDPNSLPDPDGTRADMGAFYFHQGIFFSPEEFVLNLQLGTSAEKLLSLQNPHTDTVFFSLTSGVDWISFSPDSGYILPNSSLDVNVSFDGTGLPLGPNEGTILLETVTSYGQFQQEIPAVVNVFSLEYTYIALTPDTLPITIPPEGGWFSYWAQVYNSSDYTYRFDIWIDATMPDGSTYGPIHLREKFRFRPGYTESRHLTQNVPAYAPPGEYCYNFKMGVFPDHADYQESFNFTKLESAPLPSLANITSWDLHGWDEEFIAYLGENRGETGLIPTQHALSQNYPNPFNATTTINYRLPADGYVSLEVYNLFGQKVATPVDERQGAGYKSVVWDASDISSGLYFYKLTVGDFTETKRMMLVK